MPSQKTKRASEKTDKYRFAQNVGGDGTVAEREYEAYARSGMDDQRGDPDVLLDVPTIKVDSIHLEVDDLDAHVALKAQVLDLVKLNAGVDVHLGKLRIDIKGVEAQALLKVRLDHVAAIVDRVLTTIDRNPELVKSLGRTTEQIGEGAGHALGETGEALEEIGQGAEGAVEDVGQGAGQAVGEIGEGAGSAVGDVGEGAGEAVGEVGEGAGEAVGDLGETAGQAVEGGLLSLAKFEAKGVGLAAARKAKEIAERRKQRKAGELNATEAALRTADDLGVELKGIEGSGPGGRITIRDVRQAQEG
jgi:pyruvate/2-oxoglutarate dehydrogenase complex dihydrolipoamide acyltransferase (E2) component